MQDYRKTLLVQTSGKACTRLYRIHFVACIRIHRAASPL
jgi:hypothetical protein